MLVARYHHLAFSIFGSSSVLFITHIIIFYIGAEGAPPTGGGGAVTLREPPKAGGGRGLEPRYPCSTDDSKLGEATVDPWGSVLWEPACILPDFVITPRAAMILTPPTSEWIWSSC